MSHMYTDVYIGTEIDNLIANILLSMYHTKAEVDDTHNELPTLIRFFCTKAETDNNYAFIQNRLSRISHPITTIR